MLEHALLVCNTTPEARMVSAVLYSIVEPQVRLEVIKRVSGGSLSC